LAAGDNGKLWLALVRRSSQRRYGARRGNVPYLLESLAWVETYIRSTTPVWSSFPCWFRPFGFPNRGSSHPVDESRPLFGEGNWRMIRITFWPLLLVLLAASSDFVVAQDSTRTPSADKETPPQISPLPQQFSSPAVDLKSLPKNLVLDQKDFWTAPLHFSHKQWEWT